MILDVNVLLYAADASSSRNPAAIKWLESTVQGPQRLGLPLHTIAGFLRIATNPRISAEPHTPTEAVEFIEGLLAAPSVWVPQAGAETAAILTRLVTRHQLTGALVPDALLAAHAIEHGVPVVSTDGDFARFDEVTWVNPLA